MNSCTSIIPAKPVRTDDLPPLNKDFYKANFPWELHPSHLFITSHASCPSARIILDRPDAGFHIPPEAGTLSDGKSSPRQALAKTGTCTGTAHAPHCRHDSRLDTTSCKHRDHRWGLPLPMPPRTRSARRLCEQKP